MTMSDGGSGSAPSKSAITTRWLDCVVIIQYRCHISGVTYGSPPPPALNPPVKCNTCPANPEKFTRDNVIAPFSPLSVVIVAASCHGIVEWLRINSLMIRLWLWCCFGDVNSCARSDRRSRRNSWRRWCRKPRTSWGNDRNRCNSIIRSNRSCLSRFAAPTYYTRLDICAVLMAYAVNYVKQESAVEQNGCK